MRITAVALAVATLALSACKEQGPPPPIELTVWNNLMVPVEVSGHGGTASISAESYDVLSVPASLSSLTVDLESAKYSSGADIPDDLDQFLRNFSAGATEVELHNVVSGQTYFAPRIFNNAGVTVEIAIVQGTAVQCLATMAAGQNFQFGYYLLQSATQVRAYQAGSNCTGSYRFWSTTTLNTLDSPSGYVGLSLTTAP